MDINIKKPGLFSWLLFFACISFPYLLLARKLGYYNDDWLNLDLFWGYKSSNHLRDFCNFDRVNMFFMANTFFRYIGETALAWHLWIYVSIMVFGYLVYRLIRKINYFDGNTSLAIAGIVTLYPCFTMFQSTGYLSFCLSLIYFICSLLLSISNYKNIAVQIFAVFLSAVITFFNVIQLEHFAGLELSRFLIVFVLLTLKEGGEKPFVNIKVLKKAFYLNILNYVAIFGYLFWRMFIFHTIRRETNQAAIAKSIFAHPVKAIIERVPKMISDVFLGLFGSVFHVFSPEFFTFRDKAGFVSIVFVLICAIFVFIFRKKIIHQNIDSRFDLGSKRFHLNIAAVLGITVCICMLPGWFVDKHIQLDSPNTRFGVASQFSCTLILVLLLSTFMKKEALKYTLWIYLAVCSVFFYRTFLTAESNWKDQKEFYSQIMWRYPNLPIGSSFLADGRNIPNFQLSPVVNFIYGYSESPMKMNYMAHIWWHPDLTKEDSAIMKVHFDFQPKKQIPMTYETGNCVKFGKANGPFQNGITPSFKSYLLNADLAPDSIGKSGNVAKWPTVILGKELTKACYCYYFQKAEYYNSINKYKTTDSLFTNLISQKKKIDLPKDITEWMPFITASLKTNGEANTLSTFKDILSADDLKTISKINILGVASSK